jgi:large subunit ribosomal protein L25
MEDFIVNAEPRTAQGKGASRRLRGTGKVPAIIYGGESAPVSLQISANELFHHLENEAFFSHILVIKTAEGEELAVLKDLQRHPAKSQIALHVDFQRVVAGQELRMNVPLHFVNEGGSPAGKKSAVIEHLATEVEIFVLPKDLPEFIEVDCAAMDIGDTIHLSALILPKGVRLVALTHDEDTGVAVAHLPRAAVEPNDEGEAAAEEAEEA